MKRTTRRVGAAAAAALGGSLLLSACNAHPGQAAYVGGQAISTHTLQGVLDRSLTASECGKNYAKAPVVLERVKLSDLVNSALLEKLAQRLGVSVGTADVQSELRAESDVYGGQRVIELQASRGNAIAPQDLDASVRTRVLEDRIADALTARIPTSDAQLRQFYEAHQQTYLSGHARDMVLTDKQTADQVVARLKSDPGAFGALLHQQAQAQQAKGLNPGPQAVAELGPYVGLNPKSIVDNDGYIGRIPLSQLAASGYPTKPGSVFALQLSNGWNVVEIVDNQSFGDVKLQVRRDLLANQRRQALQKALADQAHRTPVEVNPRYGRWDSHADAVVPASSDVVTTGAQQPTVTRLQCGQGQG